MLGRGNATVICISMHPNFMLRSDVITANDDVNVQGVQRFQLKQQPTALLPTVLRDISTAKTEASLSPAGEQLCIKADNTNFGIQSINFAFQSIASVNTARFTRFISFPRNFEQPHAICETLVRSTATVSQLMNFIRSILTAEK
jgi:hypothetical protein